MGGRGHASFIGPRSPGTGKVSWNFLRWLGMLGFRGHVELGMTDKGG